MRPVILIILLLFVACDRSPAPEEAQLMKNISEDQLQRNNDLVSSMGARLEYYGSAGQEATYCENSFRIMEMRNDYLSTGTYSSIFDFNDSLNYITNSLNEDYRKRLIWNEKEEQLNDYFRQELSTSHDSLAYYRFFYITLKKEYALHKLNALLMSH